MNRTTLLALLLACGTAQAADWVSLGNVGAEDSEQFVDVSSIRVAGDIRRAIVKVVFVTPVRSEMDPGKSWRYGVGRSAFNCIEKSFRDETLTIYYTDGTKDSKFPKKNPIPWTPATPDTFHDAFLKFICAWTPN